MVAAVVLVAGVGLSFLLKGRGDDPGNRNSLTQAIPTGPIALNTLGESEASQLYDSTQNINALAQETYGDQYEAMFSSGSVFQVEYSALEPLVISVGWCSLNQAILEENYGNIELILVFNGQDIPDNDTAVFDQTAGGVACRERFAVIDHWDSGTYSVSSAIRILAPIDDGIYEHEEGITKNEYIVTIP